MQCANGALIECKCLLEKALPPPPPLVHNNLLCPVFLLAIFLIDNIEGVNVLTKQSAEADATF